MTEPIDYSAYEADAREAVSTENILARITRTVRDLDQANEEVTEAEAKLKAAQQRKRQLEEFTLPELMKEAGQEMCRTADGHTVELTETLHASIPAANLPQAIQWLSDHNQGAIVKRDIRLQFTRNEQEKADNALALILEAGFTPTDKPSVHPQTLGAVIREMLANGEEVPLELLGAHVRAFAKVKPPKK